MTTQSIDWARYSFILNFLKHLEETFAGRSLSFKIETFDSPGMDLTGKIMAWKEEKNEPDFITFFVSSKLRKEKSRITASFSYSSIYITERNTEGITLWGDNSNYDSWKRALVTIYEAVKKYHATLDSEKVVH